MCSADEGEQKYDKPVTSLNTHIKSKMEFEGYTIAFLIFLADRDITLRIRVNREAEGKVGSANKITLVQKISIVTPKKPFLYL